MSWGTSFTVPRPDAVKRIQEATIPQMDESPLHFEIGKQFDVAKQCAVQIVVSTVTGLEYPYVHVSLTGHANPGHRQAEGWANDTVGVNVAGVSQEHYDRYYSGNQVAT